MNWESVLNKMIEYEHPGRTFCIAQYSEVSSSHALELADSLGKILLELCQRKFECPYYACDNEQKTILRNYFAMIGISFEEIKVVSSGTTGEPVTYWTIKYKPLVLGDSYYVQGESE